MEKFIINKIHRFLTKNKIIVSVVIIVGFVSAVIGLVPTLDKTLELEDSPGSIGTINQSGGTNIVLNNPPLPRPITDYSTVVINEPKDGNFYSRWKIEVMSSSNGIQVTSEDSIQVKGLPARYCGPEKTDEDFPPLKLMNGTIYSSRFMYFSCTTPEPLPESIKLFIDVILKDRSVF